jgi:hypothetical protein
MILMLNEHTTAWPSIIDSPSSADRLMVIEMFGEQLFFQEKFVCSLDIPNAKRHSSATVTI